MRRAAPAPRVTVLLAVRDGAPYVGEAVASVLAQTYRSFELVVIDDGSVDETPALLAGIADERIRILRNDTPRGLAGSLNRGLASARGELVARLDADDIAEGTRLHRQVAAMDANPDLALLGSWYTKIDANGAAVARRRLPCTDAGLRWSLYFHSPFVHSAVLFRTVVVRDRLGGYDERLAYSMDYELWTRIAKAYEIANLAEYLVRIRVHDRSMTATPGIHLAEGRGLRAGRVAALLGWAHDKESARTRHDAIARLYLGSAAGGIPRDIDEAVGDLLALYHAFVTAEMVPASAAARIRRELHRRAARNLVDLAFDCRTLGRVAEARAALRAAWGLDRVAAARRRLGHALRRRAHGQRTSEREGPARSSPSQH